MRKLGGKSDNQLLVHLKDLRGTEVTTVADVLLYLEEVQFRKLDLAMGYSSLYTFCREELGYSKDEAYLRFRAAEAMRISPGVEKDLRRGRLHVTTLMQAQVAFKSEDARRLQNKIAPLTKVEKSFVLNEIAEDPKSNAKKILAERFPDLQKKRDSSKPIGKGLTLIQFTVSESELKDLERLKDLLAHKNFDGDWRALFKELAQIGLDKLDPARKAAKKSKGTEQPKAETPPPVEEQLELPKVVAPKRKYISIHVKREVQKAAAYQCQFVDKETGRRCSCKHGLQIDHIQPLSLGGSNDVSNLRILCGRHNRFAAWQAGVGVKNPNRQDAFE